MPSPVRADTICTPGDLAAWIIHAAETNLTGPLDAVGLPTPRGDFLAEIARGIGATCRFTWADRAFLEAQDVRKWAGPRSLPLWMPHPENAGFLARSPHPALAAGLALRPLAETARDTLAWARAATSRHPTAEEAELMRQTLEQHRAAYRARPDDARQLIAQGASKPDPALDPVELAAWTLIANLVLNLDELVTKG